MTTITISETELELINNGEAIAINGFVLMNEQIMNKRREYELQQCARLEKIIKRYDEQ